MFKVQAFSKLVSGPKVQQSVLGDAWVDAIVVVIRGTVARTGV